MSHLVTRPRPARRSRAAAVVLALTLGLGLSGCTADGGAEPDGSDAPDAATSSAAAPPATDPPPPAAGTADMSSPFIVAASAVGTRSRDQVLLLHALGVSTTHEDGVPHELVAAQAEPVGADLAGLVAEATMMEPPAGTPAALLVGALQEYTRLADELAGWAPEDEAMPAEWFEDLEQADEAWVEALRTLSEITGEDLLDDLPELVLPEPS